MAVARGMRDSQKFVALLALAYAVLGARGVDGMIRSYDDRVGAVDGPGSGLSSRLPSRPAAIRFLLVAAILLAPLAYAWPMAAGMGGQLTTTEYPDGWHEANDLVADDSDSGRILFLPWHGYLAFPWADGTIANPADAFFDRPVLRSRSVDLAGVENRPPSPAHAAVESILGEPDAAEPFGAAVAPAGVEYVTVAKVADYGRYDYLRSQPDLAVVLENDDLIVYENAAFDRAPAPEEWPRSRPAVSPHAAGVGALCTLATLVWCHLARRKPYVGN